MSAHSLTRAATKALSLVKRWKNTDLPYSSEGKPFYDSEVYRKYYEEQEYVLPFEDTYLLVKFERNLEPPSEYTWGIRDGKAICYITAYTDKGKFHTVKASSIINTVRFLEKVSNRDHFAFDLKDRVVFRYNNAPEFGSIKAINSITKEGEVEYLIQLDKYGTAEVWDDQLNWEDSYNPENYIENVIVDQLMIVCTSNEEIYDQAEVILNKYHFESQERERFIEFRKLAVQFFSDYQKDAFKNGWVNYSQLSSESFDHFAKELLNYYKKTFKENV